MSDEALVDCRNLSIVELGKMFIEKNKQVLLKEQEIKNKLKYYEENSAKELWLIDLTKFVKAYCEYYKCQEPEFINE